MSFAKELSAYVANRMPGYYSRSNHAAALVTVWRTLKRNSFSKACRWLPANNWGIREVMANYEWHKHYGR